MSHFEDSNATADCNLENIKLVHRILSVLKQRSILTGKRVPAICGQPILVSPPLELARGDRETLGIEPLAQAEIMCPDCTDIHELMFMPALNVAA